ncbi:MAG: PDZ domain-containing protein [Candidatus Zixiibacteriota bacterium]
MTNRAQLRAIAGKVMAATVVVLLTSAISPMVRAQDFDFGRLEGKVEQFAVVIEMQIEFSFGMHSTEQELELLGTIVSDDGLVIFDGSILSGNNPFQSMSGMTVKATPTRIEIRTLNDQKYVGEYVGTDRFTRIGFARIVTDDDTRFEPVRFESDSDIKVGDWLALYMLLPSFMSPSLAADVGMVSTLVESPEYFPLTVGFGSLQMTSVLFDEKYRPVGVLGGLTDPSAASHDGSGLIESFGQYGIPLLGLITADRLEKLIADPPNKGKIDRGWLGITLQALTDDMAEFWRLDLQGGIIVNEVIRNSPADKAQLRVGDIIYSVNGQGVEVDDDNKIPIFQRKVAELGPNAPVEIGVLRLTEPGVDSLVLLATLETAPLAASEAVEYENIELEFKVRNLVFADYMRFQREAESFNGVVVSELKPGGLASLGGLRISDVIVRIGDVMVPSVEDAEKALKSVAEQRPQEIVFFVWRNQKTMFVNVKTDWN